MQRVTDMADVAGSMGDSSHQDRHQRVRSPQHEAGPEEDVQWVQLAPPERMITLSLQRGAPYVLLLRTPLKAPSDCNISTTNEPLKGFARQAAQTAAW